MHKLKKYWEKVSADPVKIEEMEEIVCEALEEVRGRCPRLFWDTAYKLHCVAKEILYVSPVAPVTVASAPGTATPLRRSCKPISPAAVGVTSAFKVTR